MNNDDERDFEEEHFLLRSNEELAAEEANPFSNRRHDGRMEGQTSVTADEAWLMFHRYSELAARTALGDGLGRNEVADALETLAAAIRTQNCAEDMSPLIVHMA